MRVFIHNKDRLKNSKKICVTSFLDNEWELEQRHFCYREAFLPWKKSPGKANSVVSKRYRDLEGTFFLMRIRPKKDLGLIEGTPPHYLSYFVQVRFNQRSHFLAGSPKKNLYYMSQLFSNL